MSKTGFVRQVVVLAGGTALGQLIATATAPLLTRLYDPADFGVLGVYAALLTVIVAFASLRYEYAIPVSDDEEEAASLLVLCVLIVCAVAGTVWAIGSVLKNWSPKLSDALALGGYEWLLPLGVLGGGIYKSLTYWAFRNALFSEVARTRVQQRVGQVVVQLTLGTWIPGPFGLIFGHYVGQSGGILFLAKRALFANGGALRGVTLRRIRSAARRYIRFPLYSSWAGVLNTASVQLPNVVFAAAFGPRVAGYYTLSYLVLQVPMRFVGEAVGQVFFSSAAKARRAGGVATVTFEVFSTLIRIGVPSLVILTIGLPELFAIVFGEEWRVAGTYSMWLAPLLTMVFVGSPLSTLTSVLERQHNELAFQIGLIAGRVVSLAIGVMVGHPVFAVAAYGIASAACWLWYVLWILRVSGNSRRAGMRVFMKEIARSTPYALPVLAAVLLGSNSWLLVGTLTLSVAVFVLRTVYELRGTVGR